MELDHLWEKINIMPVVTGALGGVPRRSEEYLKKSEVWRM